MIFGVWLIFLFLGLLKYSNFKLGTFLWCIEIRYLLTMFAYLINVPVTTKSSIEIEDEAPDLNLR